MEPDCTEEEAEYILRTAEFIVAQAAAILAEAAMIAAGEALTECQEGGGETALIGAAAERVVTAQKLAEQAEAVRRMPPKARRKCREEMERGRKAIMELRA